MSGKIEISRELGERLVAKLYGEIPGNPDDEVDELRALLAAPVCETCHGAGKILISTVCGFVHKTCDRCKRAAPVVERQEPVAWMFRWDYDHGNGWCRNAVRFVESMEHVEHEDKSTWRDITPLFASPPAPVAVVTPDQVEIVAKTIYAQWCDHPGFVPWARNGNSLKQDEARRIAQACLDKVKELNQ